MAEWFELKRRFEMLSVSRMLNKPILLSKAMFLAVYAAASVLLPFLALYYEQRGFSGVQIGLLAGIAPVMTMVGASVWGGLADATQRHKLVFILAILGSIVSVVLVPFTGSIFSLGLVIALHSFSFMSLLPLIDNTALEVLGNRSDRYGQIRLWGTIGWGIGAPLIGPLVAQFDLNMTFYMHAALMLGGLLIAVRLPVAQKSIGGGFGKGLRDLLQDQRWYLFLLVIFVAGFGDALVRNYWFRNDQRVGRTLFLKSSSRTAGDTQIARARGIGPGVAPAGLVCDWRSFPGPILPALERPGIRGVVDGQCGLRQADCT
jgi:PPP family 3-phenylpropionic acid transporter